MSDETLLQQAKALARQSTVSAGGTIDGQMRFRSLAVHRGAGAQRRLPRQGLRLL